MKQPHYCRVMLIKDAPLPGPRVGKAQDIAAAVRPLLDGEPCECMFSVVLNARKDIVAVVQVSKGTLTQALGHPREVFRPVLLANGAGLVVVHNHPSGDATPSPDDHALTARLRSAGELLAIPLLDHVIVGGEGRFFSYAEAGWPR